MAYALSLRLALTFPPLTKARTKESSTMTMIVTSSGSRSKQKIWDLMTHFTTKLIIILSRYYFCCLRFNQLHWETTSKTSSHILKVQVKSISNDEKFSNLPFAFCLLPHQKQFSYKPIFFARHIYPPLRLQRHYWD